MEPQNTQEVVQPVVAKTFKKSKFILVLAYISIVVGLFLLIKLSLVITALTILAFMIISPILLLFPLACVLVMAPGFLVIFTKKESVYKKARLALVILVGTAIVVSIGQNV